MDMSKSKSSNRFWNTELGTYNMGLSETVVFNHCKKRKTYACFFKMFILNHE